MRMLVVTPRCRMCLLLTFLLLAWTRLDDGWTSRIGAAETSISHTPTSEEVAKIRDAMLALRDGNAEPAAKLLLHENIITSHAILNQCLGAGAVARQRLIRAALMELEGRSGFIRSTGALKSLIELEGDARAMIVYGLVMAEHGEPLKSVKILTPVYKEAKKRGVVVLPDPQKFGLRNDAILTWWRWAATADDSEINGIGHVLFESSEDVDSPLTAHGSATITSNRSTQSTQNPSSVGPSTRK